MKINYLAVLVAGLASWLLGALWYSVLFANKWIELMGWDSQKVAQIQQQGTVKPMVISLIAALMTACILAVIFARAGVDNLVDGLKIAGYIWLGFIAFVGIDTVIFEERKYGLYQINSTYHLISLLIAGAILAVWRKKS